LDTLTDRNQHKDFENFARRLCEREICPNLRPQPGPEGGGDGKVDTETYPVDDKIAERWFVGDRSDGQAKWGFAFSAKKDWANKVRSDVEGIVGTNRGYEKIFFVTSRPTRAKDRLRVEDELRSAHGVSVTILDREWILDRVFSHGHKDLAFECLAAGEHDPNSVKLGPNDFKNQQTLTEIEQALARMGDTQSDYNSQAVSGRFSLYVAEDMKVYPCSFQSGLVEGDILSDDTSLLDIWHGSEKPVARLSCRPKHPAPGKRCSRSPETRNSIPASNQTRFSVHTAGQFGQP
jgi:hypothetical protein